MRIRAYQNKDFKAKTELDKIQLFSESLKGKLLQIIDEMPPISKGESKPTLTEFLLHIQKPKEYTIQKQRGIYLDALLLSTGLPIWHINGQQITSMNQISQSKPTNDIIGAVKNLLQTIY